MLSCAVSLCLSAACGADGASGPDQSSRLPIAYSFNADGIYTRRIYLASADGKTTRLAFDLGGDQAIPQWAPDGHSLLLWRESGVTKAVVVNEDGSAMRDVPGIGNLTGGWSPDGAWIVFGAGDQSVSTIDVMHVDGTARRTVVSGPQVGLPSWSATGRIAFNRATPGGGFDIWAVDVDGSNPTRLTTGSDDEYPAWSPDGKRLAFMIAEPVANGFDYYVGVVNADGTGRRKLTTEADASVRIPRWSPDGQWILYERYAKPSAGGCSFAKVSSNGGSAITVIPATPKSVCGGATWR